MKSQDNNAPFERRTTERRKSQLNFVIPERRSGFCRRTSNKSYFSQLLLFFKENTFSFIGILVAINLLNIADYLYTLNALIHGAIEVNPVMKFYFSTNVSFGVIYKLLMVLTISLIIWKYRRYKAAILANLVILLIFCTLLVYHIGGLIFFL